MDTLFQDVRYAIRSLGRSPGFILVALASLALGIGANTAIFSLVDAALFRPLPVERADTLVSMFTTDRKNPGNLPVSHLNYLDYRDQNEVLAGLAAFTFTQMNLTEGETTEEVLVQVVSGNYFSVLGVRPARGRTFVADEDRTPGSHPVAVLSEGFWQRRFGGDPTVVGRTISLNRQAFTVVGIAPKGFDGTLLGVGPALWVPMMMHEVAQPGFEWYNTRRGLFLFLVGRLKAGVGLQQARAALAVQATHLEQAFPHDNEGRGIALLPLLDARVNPNGQGQVFVLAGMLMGVVGIVLLIACANLAGLLLARAAGRRREIAIRLALGATRPRVVRLLLVESLIISLVAGAAGLLASSWTIKVLLSRTIQLGFPVTLGAEVDLRVAGFALALSILTGLLFGLAPAIQASRPDVVPVLKNELVPAGGRLRGFTLRKALVVFQVALSLVALVASGLLVRSLRQAEAVDPGFETERVMVMSFNLGREGYTPDRGRLFYEQLIDRMTALPGVRAATVAQNLPFAGGISRSVFLEGQEATSRNGTLVQVNAVGLRYFDTLGIPILAGRDFARTDGPEALPVVIINKTMADRFWKGQDPVGKRFRFFGDQQLTEVVGVVRDSKYNALVEQSLPFMYQPFAQAYSGAASLHVRTVAGAAALVGAAREAIRQMDPHLTIAGAGTLRDQVNRSLTGQRLIAWLLAAFGTVALLLAAIGIYGVASYSVAQRTREIGIRMALGAGTRAVLGLVLGQGLALVVIGVVAGTALSLVVAPLLAGLVFGVRTTDPLTFAATISGLAAVGMLATYLPARRATRVDPLVALRDQ